MFYVSKTRCILCMLLPVKRLSFLQPRPPQEEGTQRCWLWCEGSSHEPPGDSPVSGNASGANRAVLSFNMQPKWLHGISHWDLKIVRAYKFTRYLWNSKNLYWLDLSNWMAAEPSLFNTFSGRNYGNFLNCGKIVVFFLLAKSHANKNK